MNLSVGDLVRLIEKGHCTEGCAHLSIGDIGSVVEYVGPRIMQTGDIMHKWIITFHGESFSVAEHIVRKIPHDEAGRKVVDFNWRQYTKEAAT